MILLARHPDEVGLVDGAGVAPVVVVVVPIVVVVVAAEVVVVVVVPFTVVGDELLVG